MKIIRTLFCILSVIGFFASPIRAAEIPSGTHTEQFTNNLCLWDVSGTYSENLGEFEVDYTLVMDAEGKITGDGTFFFNGLGSDYLTGDFTVTGSVKSSGGLTRVALTLNLAGGGFLTLNNHVQYNVQFTGKATEKLEIDLADREMVGTSGGSVKVTIPALNATQSASIPKGTETVDLPDEVDGAWALTLNLVPSGNTLTGTATVDLSNGKSFNLNVAGTYSPKKDNAKLALKGLLKSVALNIVVASANQQMNIQTLKGSALGQKVAR